MKKISSFLDLLNTSVFNFAIGVTFILTLVSNPYKAQIEINHSPDSLLETVFDRQGNQYKLEDIRIETDTTKVFRSSLLCSSGYFDIYFETGSGMEGSSSVEIARRSVVCQVFSDISDFINSPLSNVGNPNRVNIEVRDISQFVTTPSTSGVLGAASSFYNVPYNTTSGFGGIADNEIWKTIHSGIDSYTNVTAPISPAGSSFYHGMMYFNFSNSGISWNTDLSLASSPTGLVDLYTVVLHEVTHALGFASLIDENGLSKFGTGYNYYSRYDLFLKDHTDTDNLITNTGSCSLYDYQYNPLLSLTEINPGGCSGTGSSDNTTCIDAAVYSGSTVVPLYTPNCFEPPSSLSHFEDQCYPTTGTPYGNNLYFNMSNALGTGAVFTKRYLKTEERLVLCDLGYITNTTFGSLTNNNYFNYSTSTCSGIDVAGINDGISSTGIYQFSGTVANNITISGILSNDYNATSFECLEDVFDPSASLSVTSGTSSTNITFNSSIQGVHLLRYIPVYSGQRGNITYIYVYVGVDACSPSACNMISNGDFETLTTAGDFPSAYSQITKSCGWDDANNSTADFFHSSGTLSWVTVPCSGQGFEPDNKNLNAYAGFAFGGIWMNNECMFSALSTPLLPNTTYKLTFDVSLGEAMSANDFPLQIYFENNFVPAAGMDVTITNPSMLFTPAPVDDYDGWSSRTLIFTTGATAGETHIIMGALRDNYTVNDLTPAPPNLNGCSYNNFPLQTNPANDFSYCFIDNLVLLPEDEYNGTLTIPTTLCINQPLTDLSLYANPPGGVFSGNGVILNAGIYSFDPALVGVGSHNITYTYTSNTGCVYDISTAVTVISPTISLTTTANPSSICLGETSTLTASGGTTYEWNPGNYTGNPYTVSPTTTTTYTVTGTDANGCTSTATTIVTVDQNCGSCTNCPIVLSGTITTTPLAFNTYCINSDITIAGNVNFVLSQFKIAPNVTITVDPTAVLTITGSHLYACDGMWQGIVVKPGGSIVVNPFNIFFLNRSSLIEDAFIAIDVESNNTITNNPISVISTTFNRNQVGIRIKDYSTSTGSTTYPMNIVNTVFTCRDIPFSTASPIWPHTNTIKATNGASGLAAPYIDDAVYSATNTNAFLKAPYSPGTIKPVAGIVLKEVGYTQLSPSIAYHEIKIGMLGALTFNLFDNLSTGISAASSNFTSINNVFQHIAFSPNAGQGNAINAVAENLTNNRLRVIPALGKNFTNRFYDCGKAISSEDYLEQIATDCEVYSTHVTTAPNPSPLLFKGQYGFIAQSNRFLTVNFSDNKMYNIENGISFIGNYGPLQGGGPVINGQYSGQIDINNNKMRPNLPGNAVTTQYVANAITVSNVIGSNLIFLTGSTININNNTLTSVYRGIGTSTWVKKDVKTNDNTITLVQDAFATTPLQYGIGHHANGAASGYGNSITGNTVTGFGITQNANVRAIVTALCNNLVVRCNTVSNTFKGIEFNGDNTPTAFAKNNMTNHRYGLVLDNAGAIGVQGDATHPTDNRWVGAWAAPNFKTATLATATASTAIGSELWVRNTSSVFNPNGSGFTDPLFGIPFQDDYFNNGSATSTLKYITNNPLVTSCTTLTPCCPDAGRVARWEQLVQNLDVLVNNIAETRYINKNKVYRMLRNDQSLMANSAILQDFYYSRVASNSETIAAVEDDFMLRDLTAGQSKANSITAENNIEQNYLSFFNSYVKQQTDTILPADSLALVELAMGCPFTDGEVVYQARALYNSIYMSNVIFEDGCSSENARMMEFFENSKNNSTTDIKVDIYPNPTSGETTLILEGEDKDWLIAVSDIQGRKIHKKNYSTNKINLKLVEENGVYFVHITNNSTNKTITKKLIINK